MSRRNSQIQHPGRRLTLASVIEAAQHRQHQPFRFVEPGRSDRGANQKQHSRLPSRCQPGRDETRDAKRTYPAERVIQRRLQVLLGKVTQWRGALGSVIVTASAGSRGFECRSLFGLRQNHAKDLYKSSRGT